ncbi:hypothetical protein AJ79_03063 [Helicocarpus griseus UAMH5409]|uniref:Uncharacterized protein n=1 Tax=Helicocarpus griseus UAMH5409 TaxID=1447875 RepID=A0A2B7XZH3_9EURO|nr:hypothetical protein AJ79_03063 [Helicocarpus griseus UAMH5409]
MKFFIPVLLAIATAVVAIPSPLEEARAVELSLTSCRNGSVMFPAATMLIVPVQAAVDAAMVDVIRERRKKPPE